MNIISVGIVQVTVNNIAPDILTLDGLPTDPIPMGELVELLSTFTDPGLLDTQQ